MALKIILLFYQNHYCPSKTAIMYPLPPSPPSPPPFPPPPPTTTTITPLL